MRRGDTKYADVIDASFHLPDKDRYRGFEEGASITLETLPQWVDVTEQVRSVTTKSGREAVVLLENVEGDFPARMRAIVKDTSGVAQSGLRAAVRSRNYDSAPTARLAYSAEEFTPIAPAEQIDVTFTPGGSIPLIGGNVASNWTPLFSTDLLAEGALTHIGSYRVRALVFTGSQSDPEFRLIYDVGDLTRPEENRPVAIPGTENTTSANVYWVDLGTIRIDKAPMGAHRWQGIVQGRVPTEVDADLPQLFVSRLHFEPLDEGQLVVRSRPSLEPGLAAYSEYSTFSGGSTVLQGRVANIGGTWAVASGSSTDDFRQQDGVAHRDVIDAAGSLGRMMLLPTARTDIVAQVDFRHSTAEGTVNSMVVARGSSIGNHVEFGLLGLNKNLLTWQAFVGGTTSEFVVAMGQVAYDTSPLTPDEWFTVRLAIDRSGNVRVWGGPRGIPFGAPLMTGYASVCATGGALASGKVGILDKYRGVNPQERDYDNFIAWVPESDAVIFPNRSLEIRHDGVFRESADGGSYGPLVPEGDLLRLPASGLEARPAELFVATSRGDFDQLPDSGFSADGFTVETRIRSCWLTPMDD